MQICNTMHYLEVSPKSNFTQWMKLMVSKMEICLLMRMKAMRFTSSTFISKQSGFLNVFCEYSTQAFPMVTFS